MADTTILENQLQTRYITIKLILDSGVFPDTGTNTKIITANSQQNNLAVECVINKASGFMLQSAYVIIRGMSMDDVNAFSKFNLYTNQTLYNNTIEIYAGYSLDSSGYPPLAYAGQIISAGPALNLSRDRPFIINSQNGIYWLNNQLSSTAPSGTIAINTLFSNLVTSIDSSLVYTPYNVSGYCNTPHYVGTPLFQLKQACHDYGYQVALDHKKVLVAPVGQPFNSSLYELSYENGMLGYPDVTDFGINVSMRFNPAIYFGQSMKITSYVKVANNNGDAGYPSWYINGLVHTLMNKGRDFKSDLALNAYITTLASSS